MSSLNLLPKTMRAIVLDGPGPATALSLRALPIPTPNPGQCLIKIKAFGLNRSELLTRLGFSALSVTFPRVLGIEAAGLVENCPGGEFGKGQQVVALMGGMGRMFDGGYAEYTCVPTSSVIPFSSKLDWGIIGAVPETLQTAYGTIEIMDAKAGQTILIRGGTSSLGLTVAQLAKQRGMTVFSTTRNPAKSDKLKQVGVDHIIIDDGEVAKKVREIVPDGVDCALELVGVPALRDTLRAVRKKGIVCNAGMLSNEWIFKEFYVNDVIPKGVRLTAYGGAPDDLPQSVLQGYLDAVQEGKSFVPIHKQYTMDEIVQAHEDMEENRAAGKLVVVV